MIQVLVNNEVGFDFPESDLVAVIRSILADHHVTRGELSLAIVDDRAIHALNRTHLQHDFPTDVLSFVLDRTDDEIDGEVIVSSETAARTAPDYGWTAETELMLYFIHGCLHLVGYDDHTQKDLVEMRRQETHYLQSLGIQIPAGHATRTTRDYEAPI